MSDLPFAPVLLLIGLTLGLASAANAACLDLKQTNVLSFEGTLNYRMFAGPPNYEDVRKGDTPEPTYILTLAELICANGDEFVDPELDRYFVLLTNRVCDGGTSEDMQQVRRTFHDTLASL